MNASLFERGSRNVADGWAHMSNFFHHWVLLLWPVSIPSTLKAEDDGCNMCVYHVCLCPERRSCSRAGSFIQAEALTCKTHSESWGWDMLRFRIFLAQMVRLDMVGHHWKTSPDMASKPCGDLHLILQYFAIFCPSHSKSTHFFSQLIMTQAHAHTNNIYSTNDDTRAHTMHICLSRPWCALSLWIWS